MAAAIAADPTTGTAVKTVFEISVTGADSNTATGYSASAYPSEPAIVYYATLSAMGHDTLKSPLFSTNAAGEAAWLNVIVPAAATWTLALIDSSDDGTIASSSVVVA